jgi:hypothetical protein
MLQPRCVSPWQQTSTIRPIRSGLRASAQSAISYARTRGSRIAAEAVGGDAVRSSRYRMIEMHGATLNRCRAVAVGTVIAWATLIGCAQYVHAESVYKCRGTDGAVAFQDRPCASAQAESLVEIIPAPPSSKSPDYGRASRDDRGERSRGTQRSRGNPKERRDAQSYECRAADGEVFYRHTACPKQIAASGPLSTSSSRGRSAKEKGYAVSAQTLPRSEACRRIASGGSREGHERDDRVPTYDRNLGRDPCRYL